MQNWLMKKWGGAGIDKKIEELLSGEEKDNEKGGRGGGK
jgi:hypothetical protein